MTRRQLFNTVQSFFGAAVVAKGIELVKPHRRWYDNMSDPRYFKTTRLLMKEKHEGMTRTPAVLDLSSYRDGVVLIDCTFTNMRLLLPKNHYIVGCTFRKTETLVPQVEL